MHVDLDDLGFSSGGALLVKRALRRVGPAEWITVTGRTPDLAVHLRAWCRAEGHDFRWVDDSANGLRATPERAHGGPTLVRCGAGRWRRSSRTYSRARPPFPALGAGRARSSGRGRLTGISFSLDRKAEIWSADATRIYAQAAAAQWDLAKAVPWEVEFDLPEEVEDAMVRIMAYLVENETAALVVPSRFVGQIHPHFREVMQVLAIQAADEARHIEVFTRISAKTQATRSLHNRWAG